MRGGTAGRAGRWTRRSPSGQGRSRKGATVTDTSDEEVTLYDGVTELDEDGELQPVADADEDDDPEAQAGEEVPEEDES
jgi:hypothetical protein